MGSLSVLIRNFLEWRKCRFHRRRRGKDEEDMFEISSVLSSAHSKYQCIPISSLFGQEKP